MRIPTLSPSRISTFRTVGYRALCSGLCLLLVNMSVPASAVSTFGTPIRKGLEDARTFDRARTADLERRAMRSATRPLTMKEQKKLQGSAGQNPYFAGQNKWDVIYKGVNLFSGNYSTNATDLSFEGGYGIPINVTRSYSSNNSEEGPFGRGWSMSADVRSTAGGLLKSSRAPVRAPPVTMKERHSAQRGDPNAELATGAFTEPAQAVTSVDASGREETIQRDVDGILTTPPWDQNVHDAVYQEVDYGGAKYQIMLSNKTTTPDGTTYYYEKQGSYPDGTRPWYDTAASSEPANVLKVTKAVDRQGLTTTYVYNQAVNVTFAKINGTTVEHPLTDVIMANGRTIHFDWTTAAPFRVTKIYETSSTSNGTTWTTTTLTNPADKILYTYDSAGLLASVTTRAGKTTTYTYGSPLNTHSYSFGTSNDYLVRITSPQGLYTDIVYEVCYVFKSPSTTMVLTPAVVKVIAPNGVTDWIRYSAYDVVAGYPAAVDTASSATQVVTSNSQGVTGNFYAYVTPPLSSQGVTTISTVVAATRDILVKTALGDLQSSRRKTYDLMTLNLIKDENFTHSAYAVTGNVGLVDPQSRMMIPSSFNNFKNQTVTSYNFLGKPLNITSTDYTNQVLNRTATMDYAYWGADKYYQQKATKDQAGRLSLTDYYANTDAVGSRGQTRRVYSQYYSGVRINTALPYPQNTPAEAQWRYQVEVPPANVYAFNADFFYDSKGRATQVRKLQATPSGGVAWVYNKVQTAYALDTDTDKAWGQARTVIEDVGGLARTTVNQHYNAQGKADKVKDASNQVFDTVYDQDGVVQSVTRTANSATTPVATYTYGTTPGSVSYGQVVSVVDGITGATQTITYANAGGGLGQPLTVSESGGGNGSPSVTYAYNAAGDRVRATYNNSPYGTTVWEYADYLSLGDPTSPSRVFQTLRQLNSSNSNPLPEEFHYAYDTSGRVIEAAFAQTPANGFTPTGTNPYYDSSHQASTRARAHYVYDSGGRLASLEHYWDTYNSTTGTYSSEAIVKNDCDYEVGFGKNRGLKTASRTWTKQAPNSVNWSLNRTETYGYDPNYDYLTSANYGDGLANATPTWTYDVAGNRNDVVVNNLNMATSVGGVACDNDILGNRISKAGADPVTYNWDALNRMSSLVRGGVTTSYKYRADGMRTLKSSSLGSTLYRYDGQMGVQDVVLNANGTLNRTVDYALGGRGIDGISTTTGSTTVVTYPLYDTHGNMVSTLTKGAGGTYTYSALRSFDAWGKVRLGATTGDPTGRYCANLGHKQDDESDLIYMRARYYEPASGRFVSEDPARDGANWFVYCTNDTVNRSDRTGKGDNVSQANKWAGPGKDIALMLLGCVLHPITRGKAMADVLFLMAWWDTPLRSVMPEDSDMRFIGFALMNLMIDMIVVCSGDVSGLAKDVATSSSPAAAVAAMALEHYGFLSLFISLEDLAGGG